MADIELVIKISEEEYEFVQNTSFVENESTLFKQTSTERQKTLFLFDILDAIKDGTPLPEHHGRIIDESKIKTIYYHIETSKNERFCLEHTVIDGTDAPTIIEADKESE